MRQRGSSNEKSKVSSSAIESGKSETTVDPVRHRACGTPVTLRQAGADANTVVECATCKREVALGELDLAGPYAIMVN